MRWSTFHSLLLAALLLAGFVPAYSQKQLIFLKREAVATRYEIGDYFRCKLKNGEYKEGKIIDLREFQVITTNDTLDFIRIGKVRLKHQPVNVTSGIGGALFVGGILYFTIDQFNTLFVDGQKGVDGDVVKSSLALTAVGAGMLFIKPKYRKTWKYRPRTIDYTSPFYRFPGT
ncbi:MAG: hypothetical protein ACOYXA_04350 [Bacteroidota bacterium]